MNKMDQNHNVVSDEEWDVMKAMISTHIDNCPKDVTVENLRKRGSLECIAQQIQRGDENPSARLQAWYIAMLDLEITSKRAGMEKIHYLFNQHSKAGLKSFVLDTTLTETSEDDDEWKRRSIVAKLEGKSTLNYVERQQLWQAKKESKIARERKMSMPDLTNMKSRPSLIKPKLQSGQKRSGDEGYLNNITNQTGNKNKRVKTTDRKVSAPTSTATRRQSIR